MTEKEKQFNQWFDEYADGVKVFEEADMKQAYLQGRADLEEENTELKTKKIPQLERRIASIRGSHSVDAKKLNARIEQVERLKKENAELKEKYAKNITDCDICDTYCNSQLTKAKEIINDCVCELQNILFYKMRNKERIASTLDKAEQFLSEVDNV